MVAAYHLERDEDVLHVLGDGPWLPDDFETPGEAAVGSAHLEQMRVAHSFSLDQIEPVAGRAIQTLPLAGD